MKVDYITEIAVLSRTLIEAIYFTIILVVFSFILGGFKNFVIGNLKSSIGKKTVMVIGALGSTFHQLIHVFMAVVFAHRIEDVKLLQEPDKNNMLGYVDCFDKNENFYQRTGDFFIGMMPFLWGILSIFIGIKVIIPGTLQNILKVVYQNANSITLDFGTLNGIINSNKYMLETFFNVSNVANPHFFIFLLAAGYIFLSMSPDKGDIRCVTRGFSIIFIILMVFNFIDAFNMSKYTFALYIIRAEVLTLGFLEISIVIALILAIFSLILMIALG